MMDHASYMLHIVFHLAGSGTAIQAYLSVYAMMPSPGHPLTCFHCSACAAMPAAT